MKNGFWCVAFLVFYCLCIQPVYTKNETDSHKQNHLGGGIHIFKFDFGKHVATPFVVCCWVLLASLAKIGESTFLIK